MKQLNDDVMEELLHEHARHSGQADEAFLEELERKLDRVEAGNAEVSTVKSKKWKPWVGVAAAAVVGGLCLYTYQQNTDNSEGDIIAAYDAAGEFREREESHDAFKGSSRSKSKKPNVRGEVFLEETADVAERRPSSPNFSAVKVIGSSSASPLEVPVPDVDLQTPSLDFGDASEFGDAWGAASEGLNAKVPHFFAQRNARKQLHRGNQYSALIENRFQDPSLEAQKFSTFAVDVDTASYANVRRMIQTGIEVQPDAVRLEEMVNYFDYQYAQPKGEHPFAVHTEVASSPWNEGHRLVRVGIQGKDIVRAERPTSNLVFLLDVSGSMSSTDKLPLLKQSMTYLLEELNSEDTVSIVVYAGAEGVALEPTKVSEVGRDKIMQAMDQLSSGGSTAGGAGIKLAYSMAKRNFVKGGVNRIILGTDGDFNVGTTGTDELTKLVKEEAKAGTYLSVLGFGQGNLNDAMMESITNSGNGNYYYIDSIKEGRKVLLEDMMGTMVTIAKDVKVQVAFNPKQVKAYRLLGYANRMLKAEDFRNKKIDAGEIGAGHSVTAFYEVIPADGSPYGPQIDPSPFEKKSAEVKRSEAPEFKDMEELLFVKLAYKQPEATVNDESTYFQVGTKDSGRGWQESSEDFKFASSVALSSMLLRDSEHAGGGSWELARQLANEGKGHDGKAQRQEFIQLIERVSN